MCITIVPVVIIIWSRLICRQFHVCCKIIIIWENVQLFCVVTANIALFSKLLKLVSTMNKFAHNLLQLHVLLLFSITAIWPTLRYQIMENIQFYKEMATENNNNNNNNNREMWNTLIHITHMHTITIKCNFRYSSLKAQYLVNTH